MPIFASILKDEQNSLDSSATAFDKTEYKESGGTWWDSATIPEGSFIGTIQSSEFKVIDAKKGKWPTFAVKFSSLKPFAHPNDPVKEETDKILWAALQDVTAKCMAHDSCKITSSDQLRVSTNLSLFDVNKQELLMNKEGTDRNKSWDFFFFIVGAVYGGKELIPTDRWDINFTPDSLSQLIGEELVDKKVQFTISNSKNNGRIYSNPKYFHAVSPEMEEYITRFGVQDDVPVTSDADVVTDEEDSADVPF